MIKDALIIVDPGHGGRELGAVANGYKEKDLNLKVGLELKKRLSRYIENILMTRDKDEYFSVSARAKWVSDKANEYLRENPEGKVICLSIHFNAFNGLARGCETIHSIYAKPDLAQFEAKSIIELGIPFRRVFSKESRVNPGKDYYAMHRLTGKAKTVIVESLFIDNKEDTKFLEKPYFINQLAQKQTEGLLEYLKGVGAIKESDFQYDSQPTNDSKSNKGDTQSEKESHWAQKDNNQLKADGFILSDHTDVLDKSATEGMVLHLINKLRNEMIRITGADRKYKK